MAQEIERKFLVTGDGWKALAESSSLLRQGYLSSNAKATVRVRSWDDERAALTLKGRASGMTRAEYEYDIPMGDAREMLDMAQPHVLEKRRHLVTFGGLTWEVDVFEGRHEGLVIAEVELTSEQQAVELPAWVGTEVTDDDRYYNASLSRTNGVPD
ncbi:CYTH domain-containing protein [Devosia psychrophila]|uniref:Adenylate cyclase n=1 Tax=Devosia psychrophila TaxID=728005 RepID=A0A0F5PY99_9HYPH|nr:CYTH domain-containing protein [Devosia psychrophila]KKC33613.1 adenylate cyclase [Devosia psychrophila]SFC60496.1 adenylate cyclase [Devosia psychrophila]